MGWMVSFYTLDDEEREYGLLGKEDLINSEDEVIFKQWIETKTFKY